jgi:hypothetical protein
MVRTFRELLEDFQNDPTQWEVIAVQTNSSTNLRNRGGSSVQELLRHKKTGEEIIRHILLKPDGSEYAPAHFRPRWK